MRLAALAIGLINHTLFLVAISAMAVQLYYGMTLAPLIESRLPVLTNLFLLIQFPLLHSWLLTKNGGQLLTRLYRNKQFSQRIVTTSYTMIASAQLLITFLFWNPSRIVLFEVDAQSYLFYLFNCLYILSWILLAVSMAKAGLGIQSGYLGWIAVLKGKDPKYPKNFPTTGPFKICRQPIYLSFALITWSSPFFTLDKLAVASCWSLYCYFGPRLKESRYLNRWREDFSNYQTKVPYFLPRLFG